MEQTQQHPLAMIKHSLHLLLLSLLCLVSTQAADTKHLEMDYGDTLFMSLDANWPEGEQIIRKALVQKLETEALPEKGTPIGKGRVIKVKDEIEDTTLDSIYQTQRERSTGYLIAVPKGNYKITLQFCEIKRKNEAERVFDIYLQQKLIQADFDPFKVAGNAFKALDLVIDDVAVKKFLRLEFNQKSTRSTPAIAGIVIEGENFTKKINCGGEATLDYESDWDSDQYMDDPFSTGLIFDTELLRYSAAWVNGFVQLKGTAYDATHGTHPAIMGNQVWGSGYTPGWVPEGFSFNDPRTKHLGHLPKDWAHYRGLHRHENGNVIEYTVTGTRVLDHMQLLKVPTKTIGQAYVRTIQTDSLKQDSKVLLLELPEKDLTFINQDPYFQTSSGWHIRLKGIKANRLFTQSRQIGETAITSIYLNVPSGSQHFSVALFQSIDADASNGFAQAFENFNLKNLESYTNGAATRWPQTVQTQGLQGKNEGAFTVDEIVLPTENPWRSWMRPGAFDFSADGQSLYVSTWSGDIWKVEHLNDFSKLTWKRFATGLFHPLGLKVVADLVYAQCRDQIVILHDQNNDAEADYYQNFNNDVVITENFHEFSFELQRDEEGNFYFIKGAPVIAGGEGFGDIEIHHGKLFKVSRDGSKLEVIASGFRAPNGMAISPDGQLSTSDNEGNWVAASPIHWIVKNGFYGVQPTFAGTDIPKQRSPLLCWIPHNVDNSSGGQVWVPKSAHWGPYAGAMFHISYGQAKLFHVLKEEVNGQIQGGVVDLNPTGGFDAGIMRGRFNEADQAIYLCGLKGWQTKGIKDGGLYRVRYTQQKECRAIGLKVGQNGISIQFSAALDPNTALDAGNYTLSQWVYNISDQYGSKHYKVPTDRSWNMASEWSPLPQAVLDQFNTKEFKDEESRKNALAQLYDNYLGEDQISIASLSLSKDHKTLFIELPDLAPVMQMKVSFNLEDALHQKVKQEIYHTIHNLGAWKGEPGEKLSSSDLNLPQSGLVAQFTHRGQNKVDTRVQRMAAFHITEHSPVTQFLDHGPFEAELNGFIKVEQNMRANFYTAGSGTGTMSINGAVIYQDVEINPKQAFAVDLKKGYNKLKLLYSSPAKGAASFRLYWEALDHFPKEPIPAKVLFHEVQDRHLQEALLKREGLNLAIKGHCFNCHDRDAEVNLPELLSTKISLDQLGSRLNAQWVSQWLQSPKSMNPHAAMPNMLKSLPESEWSKAARDLAAYLCVDSRSTPLELGEARQGELHFGKLGCASCHHFDDTQTNDSSLSFKNTGLKFKTGQIANFILNPTQFHPASGMPNFSLTQAEALDLESYIRSMAKKVQLEPLSGDIHQGKSYFEQLNCASCHQREAITAKTHGSIFDKTGGCLTSGGNGKPDYSFTPSEREALTEFLSHGQTALKHREPIEYAERTIMAKQCLHCHSQDEQSSNWKSNNPLPSQLPPSITHAGEKLHATFLKDLLGGHLKTKPRPWMEAKMPLFACDTDLLAEGLQASHGFSDQPESSKVGSQKDVGAELVLQNGFACMVCHDIGTTKALAPFGAPGPNLQLAGKRLRHDYYLRWMLNPQRVEPGTHMTRFSNDHVKTALPVFEGNAQLQFNAIWDHLQTLQN